MANEKRLIYLEDAKEALTGWETDPTDEEIEYTLDNLPIVDAVEVVHGRWIGETGVYMWRQNCSICNGPVYNKMKPYYNYCPFCGAKMDGGNEDV